MKENINGIKYGLNQITEDYKKTTNQTKLKFNSKTPENKSVYLIKLQSKYIIPKKTKSQILNIKTLHNSNNNEKLNFINVDLFLEYISLKKPFFKNEEDNNNLIEGFCLQHKIFISQEILINKIIYYFDFFYPKKETAFELIKFINRYINLLSYYNQEELPKEIIQKIFEFLKRIKNYKGINPSCEEIIQLCEIELKEYEASLKKFSPNPHLIAQEKNEIKENIESSSDEEEDNNDNKKIIKDIFLKDAEIIYKKENFFDILKYKSIDIASELTMIKYNLFNKLKVEEFLEGNFNKKEKLNISPNICEIINRFNKLSLWVKEEILSYDKSKHRAKIIQKFIHICSSLKKLGNFDDLFSILSSFNSYIVNKLE